MAGDILRGSGRRAGWTLVYLDLVPVELTPAEVKTLVGYLREYGQLDRDDVEPAQAAVLEKIGYFKEEPK